EAAREADPREVAVFVASDRIQRHGQHQRGERAEQVQHDRQTYVARVPGHPGELPGDVLSGGRATHERHGREHHRNVEKEREPGDACVRSASHTPSAVRVTDRGQPCYDAAKPEVSATPGAGYNARAPHGYPLAGSKGVEYAHRSHGSSRG